jgi:hypothetical protein
MSHKRNEEHGKNFDEEKFWKTEIDGDVWLLGDPLKIGNIKGRENILTQLHILHNCRENK